LLEFSLSQDGYRVWSAADGREALAVYQEHRPEIDLILLDVQMPLLDGPQTLEQIRQIDPEVRCCFMSGGSSVYTLHDLRQLGAGCFFPKPIDLPSMKTMVRRQAQLSAVVRRAAVSLNLSY
jgi:DNA-binding NtrC family response regulator